jgi:tetratricopeptide (TPR) repeat protein
MRLLAVLSIAVACGGSPATPPADPTTPSGKTAAMATGLPATLESDHPKTGDPRPIHVRVWADTGVRALPNWKEQLTEQLDYAAQLLQPMFGVRLTVDKTSEWDHAGTDPRAALADLPKVDAGSDATWVIGYITPADSVSKSLDELGAGEPLGHYVIVNAWAEKPETDALAATLPDQDPTQRAEVVAAHRRHKQTVILLHELAATLGAIDEADPAWLQHPSYSPKMATFSDRNRELMQLGIDQRLGGGTDQTLAHDLLEAIEKTDWGGWIPTSHDAILAKLRNVVDAGKSGKTAVDVPPAAFDQFDHARELGKQGHAQDAIALLDNLDLAYPGNPAMAELRCEVLITKPGIADKRTKTACKKAADVAPGDPTPHFTVGDALVAANDLAGARAEFAIAAQKIANLPIGQAAAWGRLAAAYLGMFALTLADDALAQGKLDGDPAIAEIARDRARYGAPKGMFKPDAEPGVVAATKHALELVGSGKLGDASRTIATAERSWPRAPGLATARCNVQMSQGEIEAARASCAQAIASDPDESFALYLAAILAFKNSDAASTQAGIDKLKHAIAVDPDLGQAWRALGKAYDRVHDQAAHDELAKRYQDKFKQPL